MEVGIVALKSLIFVGQIFPLTMLNLTMHIIKKYTHGLTI